MTSPAPTQTTIEQMLDTLAELQAALDLLNLEKQAAIPDEVKLLLEEIEAEFQPKIEQQQALIAKATEQVKDIVKGIGATRTGAYLQAIYFKGKITWNNDKLEGFAASHPEILALRKQGEPYVVIQAKKGK